MDRNQFELAYRRAMDNDGCSYDEWDINQAWYGHQKNPADFKWIEEYKT